MLREIWQQFFPPKPTFTEKDVGSQLGKVFIVTGANQGIGFELVKMLYSTGATIYLAGRSQERVQNAIAQITSISPLPNTPAILKYLHLDLSDLAAVKAAAATFAAQEQELHILWNNAGTGYPKGSATKQGIESHIGANCVAPLLFTQELLPLLQVAAKNSPKNSNSVRVIWTGSVQIEMSAPKGGIDFGLINTGATTSTFVDYAASKVGNWFLADEASKRWGKQGIINVCENPGNVYTNIYANEPWWFVTILRLFILYEAKFGAYTMLYAGFSPDVTLENNGTYIWPWGKVQPNARGDIYQAIAAGKAAEFWEWCEAKYKPYA
ncbi:NAD(P)-binding protein [Glonium stellatum]|uniref:NAD(P)-binding protein n=1 Tax=Glonium stellatum TaxID=574774 RepID=A0A8E2JSJ0_9PEZI|nr:NAD(P)-binding protein [Glonium stellatum]